MFLNCPLSTPSHLLSFVLYYQVGVMTKRKDKTNRTTYCGKSHSKDQRADSAVVAKISIAVGGSSAWCPEMHMGHPGRPAPGATGPASYFEEQPVKTKSPHFLTHSQPLIAIQL